MKDGGEGMGGEGILMVAGEASGDLHGGLLAAALLTARHGLRISGMGGAAMRRAGVRTQVDISGTAVVGLWEVVSHLPAIAGAFRTLSRAITEEKPSLVVLIDYPDFNLRLAKVAREAGVPVVYYISPQVWAWRRGRIRTMARLVRKMLVILPFEEELYRAAGVDCIYVGNPLLDVAVENPGREALARRFGLDPARPILGLLPGSRRKELAYLLPPMLGAFSLLRESVPGLQGIVPVADTLGRRDFESFLRGFRDPPVLVEGDTAGVLDVMDAAAVASGTATLQTALHRKPMVIVYRLSPLTYLVGRVLLDVRFIGLANIVAGEEVAPELIQAKATPREIAGHLLPLFTDRALYRSTAARMDSVRERLGSPGASRRAAAEILALLGESGRAG